LVYNQSITLSCCWIANNRTKTMIKNLFVLGVIVTVFLNSTLAQVTDSYRPSGFDYNGASIKTFSVSDSTAVQFSRGNLQYNAALDKWRFALRQYSTACGDNNNIAEDYDGWIDLFGWGTSGWNSGATAYQPWSTSENYEQDYNPGGSYENSLTGAYANADWGIYNKIENGGKYAGMWRTLTADEWQYLLSNHSTGFATIQGVYKGLVILPDDWTLPEGLSFAPYYSSGYGTNQYTIAEWQRMEAAGAIFLPAAGLRTGSELSEFGVYGEYWTSSVSSSVSVKALRFWTGNTSAGYGEYRNVGRSVRLVRRVQKPLVQKGWVDMGLPSGTLWYSCNIGTTKPQGYGAYFAWGETRPKSEYSWDTYAHGTGENALTKYCNSASYGLDGFSDGLTVLQPGDDGATTAFGSSAHIPTKDEWQELLDNCTSEWTKYNGVSGTMFTSNTNGNRLFLPAAGNKQGTELNDIGTYGNYWSASLYTTSPWRAWSLGLYYSGTVSYMENGMYRNLGFSVRAVKSPNYQEWVDLGLPSGTKWYSCNIGATKPWEYGSYFAWGETTTKETYDWSNYAYGDSDTTLTKYCDNADYGLNGFTDTLTVLQPGDDAATVKLGGGARTPTKAEWQELIDNCTWEWTTMNGVNGYKVTSNANGASLFLPAAGYRGGSSLYGDGTHGYYSSSSLVESLPGGAWRMGFHSGIQGVGSSYRHYGDSVRAVRSQN